MFQKHHKNLKNLEYAIKFVERELKRYISRDEDSQTYVFTKILSHLISSWIEVRVAKLAFESCFTQPETNQILSPNSFRDKWQAALDLSIRKAYSISSRSDLSTTLPFTPRTRYLALQTIIDDELHKSYEVRNRIAHGQWQYAFRSNDLTQISSELTGRLRQENIVELQLKHKLFRSLAQIIHDLAVSSPTFERDFDKLYTKIEQQQNNYHNRDYEDYKRRMIDKYQRGLQRRRDIS